MNSIKTNKKVLFVVEKIGYRKKYFLQIIKWLKEQGYEIHIASSEELETQYCDKYFYMKFNTKKIKTYKFLREIISINNYHFIHCYTFLGGILTRFAAKKSKTKIIYTTEKFTFLQENSYMKRLIYYLFEKYLSKYTNVLITTNEQDYIFAKNKLKGPKIKLIYDLGINQEQLNFNSYEEKKNKFIKEFDLEKEDYILLNIGKLDKNNNQILQIEAIMQILIEYKNIKLLIAGEGPLEEYYNNIIQKYRLNKYIKLIGKREDIASVIQLTDLIILTNKKNKECNNMIEAMFANKPIIASRINENKEFLKDENLVSLNNANELIAKIEENIILGKRKISYNIEKYKESNIIENMKKIYKSLM